MSKLKPDKINFDKDDFVVDVDDLENSTSFQSAHQQNEVTEADLEINRAESAAQEILDNATKKAQEIIKEAQEQKENILKEAEEIKNSANSDKQNELENAKKEAEEILNNSKEEIEKQRQASANEGYSEGYKDGEQKIKEELEEKIETLNNFCKNQYEIKNKILKSASKEILGIITNISRKILFKETDKESLDKIIKKTITLLEKKENITIVVSEKYAKLLFELQSNSLSNGAKLKFEDFKQYDGFDIVYNPKFDYDTIIVETPTERFDASINSQLDIIIRDIFETSNGQIENIEQLDENEA